MSRPDLTVRSLTATGGSGDDDLLRVVGDDSDVLVVDGDGEITVASGISLTAEITRQRVPFGRPKSASGVVGPSQPGMVTAAAMSTATLTLNTRYYHPLWFERPTEIDRLYFENTSTSAGQNAYGGLYEADTDWQPVGDPLVATSAMSLTAASVKSTSFSPIVVRGLYLVSLNATASVAWRVTRSGFSGGNMGAADATLGTSYQLRSMSVAETAAAAGSNPPEWTTTVGGAVGIECFGWVRVSDPMPDY